MGRVVYFLKKPTLSNKLTSKADKEKALKNIPHLIVLQYRYSGNKVTFTFNQKVAPSNWDGKRQRVKYNKQTTEDNKFNVNEILDTLARECERAYNAEMKNGYPSPEKLKGYLYNIVYKNHGKAAGAFTLFSLIDRFISGEIKHKGRDKSLATLGNYVAAKKHLEKYQIQKKYSVDFDSITLDFFYKYTHFLKHELKLANNTIAKEIKCLKLFLGEAVDLGYTSNNAFRHKKFFYSSEETDSVYLDNAEIKALLEYDLSHKKRLEEVRDLFVFGCCVGLRYSDYSDIQAENIIEKDGKFKIHMRAKKNNELVIIPCKKLVLEIFKKYGNSFNKLPRSITIGKFDQYIKEACREAGLTETGRLASDMKKQLCDCISSHTARRSFATNLYLEGFPSYLIMKVTGHRSEKSFLRYIKVDKLETAKKLEEHWKKFEWDLTESISEN